jgi:branched-chain amino acid transport system substrate-binding protein
MQVWLSSRAVSLTAVALLLAVGCGLGPGGTTNSSQPIVVGISEPLSGDKSDIGTNSDQGYRVWERVINESGGLLGRRVRIVQYDNSSLADTAVSQYQRLITVDRADVLLGPVTSALVIPTEVVAARYGKAFIEGSGGAPQVFERHLRGIFAVQPTTVDHQADPLVAWVRTLPRGRRPARAAYPVSDDPFAAAVIDTAQRAFEALGVRTVYRHVYPPTQTDFTSIGAQLQAAGADLLVQGSVADQDGVGAVRSYAAVGFQPRISYFASGPDSANTWEAELGDRGEGTITSLSWLQESPVPGNDLFVKSYLRTYPNRDGVVPAEAAEAYAAGQVLATAIRATNTVDNAPLIAWLHGHRVQSIEGYFGWDADGRPSGGTTTLVQWQNRHLAIVYPPNLANRGVTPTYPKPRW